MSSHTDVCERIVSLYPDMGDCGDDISVTWDRENGAWAVDFAIDGQRVRHYLENEDAAACILGRQCIGMGIEFGQFH